MKSGKVVGALVLVGVGVLVYGWWISPERQIRAMLDEVAAAFTHDEPDRGLGAMSAVAGLQEHLALDVALEGPDGRTMQGRQEVIATAARIRAASPMMRVRFFDPEIAVSGDRAATVAVTAEVTSRTESGQDVVDVHQVEATLDKPEGRWIVTRARIVPPGETAP